MSSVHHHTDMFWLTLGKGSWMLHCCADLLAPPEKAELEDMAIKGLLSGDLLPKGSSVNGSPEAKGSVGVWAICWLNGSTSGLAPVQSDSWEGKGCYHYITFYPTPMPHTHTHTWLAPLVENGSDVKGSWPLNGSVTAEEEAVEGCAGLPPGATAVGVPNGSFLNRSSLIPG